MLGDETPFVVEANGSAEPKARRRGQVVLRESGPWTPAVHALLRHFEAGGFGGAPRVIGTGYADDGRETLSYLPGSSPAPKPWPADALEPLGRLVRESHDAARGFVVPVDAVWQPPGSLDFTGPDMVVAHGDLGPWNIPAVDGVPSGLIDWEFAGPMDTTWSLAEAVWLNAQLLEGASSAGAGGNLSRVSKPDHNERPRFVGVVAKRQTGRASCPQSSANCSPHGVICSR